ncbi:SET domain-containing protein [Spirulina sp. 06S082]|uniref:SET domain-containing protein n=1 Tax=Spirulina sp. 06S082 TaxID=3110248 RepID=UPI002B20699D|nr:SET domain-containing protein [Spirulina sp. 06S082]MEA5468666.1 SET domain-containing protein [Spirulina sp. 06S082]
MLLIYTTLGSSNIHGIGLFAAQFIPKGTVTWRYHPDFDIAYSTHEIEGMSLPAREQILKYAYYDQDLQKYILCFDDQRFINHSSNDPNILSTPREDIAARDIQEGEELLSDYNCFDNTYFERLGLKTLLN